MANTIQRVVSSRVCGTQTSSQRLRWLCSTFDLHFANFTTWMTRRGLKSKLDIRAIVGLTNDIQPRIDKFAELDVICGKNRGKAKNWIFSTSWISLFCRPTAAWVPLALKWLIFSTDREIGCGESDSGLLLASRSHDGRETTVHLFKLKRRHLFRSLLPTRRNRHDQIALSHMSMSVSTQYGTDWERTILGTMQ